MKKLFAKDSTEWRSWLEKNHDREQEIWLVFYKKHTGKKSIVYPESVEEALCFGWVDGIKKRIDDETYTYRFSPRKRSSKWSPKNIASAKKLIRQGRMTAAGKKAYEQGKRYDKKTLKRIAAKELALSPRIETAIKKNKKAWVNFNNLAPSYRKQFTAWLMTAKREETLQKRLNEALELLEKNRKLGMK